MGGGETEGSEESGFLVGSDTVGGVVGDEAGSGCVGYGYGMNGSVFRDSFFSFGLCGRFVSLCLPPFFYY